MISQALLQDKGLDEAFLPIFELDEAEKDNNKVLQGGMRIGVAVSLLGLSYAFYHHVPDKGRNLLFNALPLQSVA